ncbi:MAG TPA: PepSY domain-containing protein, partial [Nitrospira sp.]|nr:PepSY domain-containing protein [Nitrospira sp.]
MSGRAVTSSSIAATSREVAQAGARDRRVRVWRTWWVQAHLYLGLIVGALLVVFGLTGSILVFFQEIDEWLNPALLTVDVPADGQSS